MKATLKATLVTTLENWLSEQDEHVDRPAGSACEDLADMMADAAGAVYDASHAGYVMGCDENSD